MLEEKIVEKINNKVKSRLLGRSPEFNRILDEKPESIFFVGKLEPKYRKTNYKTIINPNSIGMDFIINNSTKKVSYIDINIKFSVFYRVYPTYEEQKEAQNSKRIRNVMKKENIEVNIPCKLEAGSYKYKDEIKNRIYEKISHEFEENNYFDLLFRNKGKGVFEKEQHLKDEKKYVRYLECRDGKTYYNRIPWDINLKLEIKEKNEKYYIKIELNNDSEKKYKNIFSLAIFDPVISVNLKENSLKEQKLDFMHNYDMTKFGVPGKGINCSLEYNKNKNMLTTSVLPTNEQKRLEPKKSVGGWEPTFDYLSKEPISVLEGISSEMEKYLEKDIGKFKEREEFKREVKRYKKGIKFLKNDPNALLSFKLLNETMIKVNKNNQINSWYLFQIIFITSNLNAALSEEIDEVEVLHVPTGGGKTWTYLGLIIFCLFYGRLTDREFGVTAWVKFPLRMLSLQQLEIISTFITHANKIKEENNIPGDPLAVGYLVGSKNTPNKYDLAEKYIDEGKDFRAISNCPFCNNKIKLKLDDERGRVYHICKECNEILPIIVVDNEIYRYLPSIIVSTIDKAAVLNYNYRAKNLFGGKISKCVKNYGYLYSGPDWCVYGDINWDKKDDVQCRFLENKKCKLEKMNGKPPLLLIQDELHMIREFDGCLDSYIEGIIEKVTKEYGGKGLKVIAPSATASGVDRQVYNLYLKEAKKFSFNRFYFGEKDEIHRISTGILPVGRAVNWATWQVTKEIEKAIQELKNEAIESGNEDKIDKIKRIYEIILNYHRSKRDANELRSGLDGVINEDLKNNYEIISPNKTDIITGEKTLEELRDLMRKIKSNYKKKRIKLIGSTLIISHGIDFDELNTMVFRGMPRSVSEYEQSRSRVGRKYPSLIFVVHHGNLSRDQSFYKYFMPFHENVNRYVENVPLYRWASKAVGKMTPSAILSSLHSYFIDKKNINNGFMKCKDLNFEMNSKNISVDEISGKCKEFLYLNSSPSIYQEDFKEETEHISKILFDLCRGETDEFITKIFQKQHFPVFSFRFPEKQIPIFPNHESATIENKGEFKLEATRKSRLSSSDEEKEDKFLLEEDEE